MPGTKQRVPGDVRISVCRSCLGLYVSFPTDQVLDLPFGPVQKPASYFIVHPVVLPAHLSWKSQDAGSFQIRSLLQDPRPGRYHEGPAQWGQAGCLCDRVWVNERHPPVGNTQRGHANLLTLNNLRKNFNQKRLQSDFNLLWAMGQKADPG